MVTFDAESAPAHFKLTRAREVIVPETLCQQVNPGVLTLGAGPGSLTAPMGDGRRSTTEHVMRVVARQVTGTRALSLLYLRGVCTTSPRWVSSLFPAGAHVEERSDGVSVCPERSLTRSARQRSSAHERLWRAGEDDPPHRALRKPFPGSLAAGAATVDGQCEPLDSAVCGDDGAFERGRRGLRSAGSAARPDRKARRRCGSRCRCSQPTVIDYDVGSPTGLRRPTSGTRRAP